MREQDPPGLGEHDAPCAPLEQRHARLALEHADLLRDRRGRVVQRLGRACQRSRPGRLPEDPETAHIEHGRDGNG